LIREGTGIRARAPTCAPERRAAVARALPVLLVVAALPACVIPLAPDFQDPPATQNLPPQIVSETPAAGSITPTPAFSVTVADPNGDVVYLHWLSDFPPYVPGVSALLFAKQTSVSTVDANGRPIDVPLKPEMFDCDQLSSGIAQHRITVIVSDRDFTGPADVPPGAGTDSVSWGLVLQCP
jgi:hypothetical protein